MSNLHTLLIACLIVTGCNEEAKPVESKRSVVSEETIATLSNSCSLTRVKVKEEGGSGLSAWESTHTLWVSYCPQPSTSSVKYRCGKSDCNTITGKELKREH